MFLKLIAISTANIFATYRIDDYSMNNLSGYNYLQKKLDKFHDLNLD